ncbi:MAG: hypothetical protein WBC85_09555 [Planktotalea sp.]|uniref:COG3904 family protein n=1 Tax=Planktotalea sp. TaxID=2029877 RepID=UPI003C7234FA
MKHLFARQTDPISALGILLGAQGLLWLYWKFYWHDGGALPASPDWPALAGGFGFVILSVWIALRAAQEHSGGGALLLKLTCTVCIIIGTVQLVNQWARMAIAPALPPAPQALLKVSEQTVYLSGELTFRSFGALQATLRAYPEINTLALNSPGGRIHAARGLARLVQESELATHVSDTCASACTLPFLAGSVRTMARDAKIGFHGYRLLSTIETLDVEQEEAKDMAAFRAAGVSEGFLKIAFKTPHSGMWFPAYQQLLTDGVLTAHGPPKPTR